jgi:hypothetical protein
MSSSSEATGESEKTALVGSSCGVCWEYRASSCVEPLLAWHSYLVSTVAKWVGDGKWMQTRGFKPSVYKVGRHSAACIETVHYVQVDVHNAHCLID